MTQEIKGALSGKQRRALFEAIANLQIAVARCAGLALAVQADDVAEMRDQHAAMYKDLEKSQKALYALLDEDDNGGT